jgi:hypothetical protein
MSSHPKSILLLADRWLTRFAVTTIEAGAGRSKESAKRRSSSRLALPLSAEAAAMGSVPRGPVG